MFVVPIALDFRKFGLVERLSLIFFPHSKPIHWLSLYQRGLRMEFDLNKVPVLDARKSLGHRGFIPVIIWFARFHRSQRSFAKKVVRARSKVSLNTFNPSAKNCMAMEAGCNSPA